MNRSAAAVTGLVDTFLWFVTGYMRSCRIISHDRLVIGRRRMTRRILFYLKLIFAANLIATMTEKQHFNDEQETKHLFSNVGYFILSKKGNLPHKYIQELRLLVLFKVTKKLFITRINIFYDRNTLKMEFKLKLKCILVWKYLYREKIWD